MIEAQINKLPHSADIEKRPLIAKKIMWEIQHAELDLYVDDIKFSNTVMRNAVGSHVYQTNKEAKVDVDVQDLYIENLLDGEELRYVFRPQSEPFGEEE